MIERIMALEGHILVPEPGKMAPQMANVPL